jgi:hypothetical protein
MVFPWATLKRACSQADANFKGKLPRSHQPVIDFARFIQLPLMQVCRPAFVFSCAGSLPFLPEIMTQTRNGEKVRDPHEAAMQSQELCNGVSAFICSAPPWTRCEKTWESVLTAEYPSAVPLKR